MPCISSIGVYSLSRCPPVCTRLPPHPSPTVGRIPTSPRRSAQQAPRPAPSRAHSFPVVVFPGESLLGPSVGGGGLFGGCVTECMPATDSNGSGNVDVADAVHIFNWRLQPEPAPAGLHPAPSAPFPNCGTDPNVVTEAECLAGSTTCFY